MREWGVRKRKRTAYAVERALLELGGTEEMVAASLADLGIKGRMHKAAHCPIAEYLRLKFPGKESYANMSTSTVDGADVKNPPQVGEFIYSFDMARWPGLIGD